MDVTGAGGPSIDPSIGSTLSAYAAAVRASPHNLLSRRALDELESRHIPECLGLAALLPPDTRTLLDVGTGGGFPGMIIAIARPEIEVSLLDSTTKKVRFLEETAQELGIQVNTLDGRSEELVRTITQRFDVVTARAVAPLERLLGWTLPWLRPGGLLFALKGEQWEAELRDALPALRRVRARVVDVTSPGETVATDDAGSPDGTTPRVVIIQTAA